MSALDIVLVPCLTDNYCVLLHDPSTGETAAIDAPDAASIKAALAERGWRLNHIFVTHHHTDHTAGILDLKSFYGASVTGPEVEAERIPGLSRGVTEASKITFAGAPVTIIETPGHTLGHVTYHFPEQNLAFTGDTLFSLGCGRVFEGTAETMWNSICKIARLPDETHIYCGHEYTLSNARFALTIEPENEALKARFKEIEHLRGAGKPTVPSLLRTEKEANPFLRAGSRSIRARLGMLGMPDWEVFARLRQLKNKA